MKALKMKGTCLLMLSGILTITFGVNSSNGYFPIAEGNENYSNGCFISKEDKEKSETELIGDNILKAKYVFSGTVLNVKTLPRKRPKPNRNRKRNRIMDDFAVSVSIRVKVEKVYKGVLQKQITLLHTARRATRYNNLSSSQLESGEKFLFYADSGRSIGKCSGTKLLADAEKDLTILTEIERGDS